MAEPPKAPSDAWIVHVDGGAVPNPGRMGMGAVMIDPQGQRHTLSQAFQGTGCNNEAELRAVMATLERLKALQATTVVVHSDSSILVEQLSVAGGKPILRLAPLFDEARALMGSFEAVTLRWIPRHRNSEADALARQALGLPLKLAEPASKRKRRA